MYCIKRLMVNKQCYLFDNAVLALKNRCPGNRSDRTMNICLDIDGHDDVTLCIFAFSAARYAKPMYDKIGVALVGITQCNIVECDTFVLHAQVACDNDIHMRLSENYSQTP